MVTLVELHDHQMGETYRRTNITATLNQSRLYGRLASLCLECSEPQTIGRRFTFQQNNDPKQTVKRMLECLINNSGNALGWPSQSSDPINIFWRNLKMNVRGSAKKNGRYAIADMPMQICKIRRIIPQKT